MGSAAIFGCQGTQLSDNEIAFFKDINPWGFILFARNIDNPRQVKQLCDDLRSCTGRTDTPILIDQEGGRVQRMSEPHWPKYPTARALGDIADQEPETASRAIWLMSRLHAFDLLSVGINVDCLPLLDVPSADSHKVIGNRAYGAEVDRVIELGSACCDGLLAGGVLPVVKHIPGHGRAGVDSHLELPRVSASREELDEKDFAPFKALADQKMAMTAHVVFESLDAENPATTSPIVINDIIRNYIGFDGLLMSDDLSMGALSGDFAERTKACLQAGCDVILHCNGDMAEMVEIAKSVGELEGKAASRADDVLTQLNAADNSNENELRTEFAGILERFNIPLGGGK